MNRLPPKPMKVAFAAFAVLTLAPGASAEELEVAAYLHDNFHILPEVIQAEPGDVLRLQVTNAGQAPHDIFFCGTDGLDAPPQSCEDPIGGPVRPTFNQTLPLTVTAPGPGTYWYYCTVAGHAAQGMVGKLVVSGEAVEPKKEAPGASALAVLGVAALVALSGRWRA